MAVDIIMPKLGNSVESCIICAWKKSVGDAVVIGEAICEVETDKAVMEVESTADGTLLNLLYAVGDEVLVLAPIATIGEIGEAVDAAQETPSRRKIPPRISPRARKLAQQMGVSDETLDTIVGSGPNGRIVSSDLQTAQSQLPTEQAADSTKTVAPHPLAGGFWGDGMKEQAPPKKISPVAKAMVKQSGYQAPTQGTGPGGRIMARDLRPHETPSDAKPLSFTRQVIAERMTHSLQSTAQLTLNTTADARALLTYRTRLKSSDPVLALTGISLHALILFATARTLVQAPGLNARLTDNGLISRNSVNLGFAVDTPRGLLVPVIHQAEQYTLRQTAHEMNRLSSACITGKILPDELDNGTFTVTNLGAFGIETFTPILNTPQIGILGVGNIVPKARWLGEIGGPTETIPQINLSLTIDHQAIDGAPAARFLQTLCQNLAEFELLLAL